MSNRSFGPDSVAFTFPENSILLSRVIYAMSPNFFSLPFTFKLFQPTSIKQHYLHSIILDIGVQGKRKKRRYRQTKKNYSTTVGLSVEIGDKHENE